MKKYLLGLFFVFITVFSFAETTKESVTTAVANTVSPTTSEANATIVFITEKLEQLAKSLSVPVQHLFQVVVKAQFISSFTYLFLLIFMYILPFSIIRYTLKDWKRENMNWRLENPENLNVKNNPNYEYWNLDEGWWVVGLIVGAILMTLTLFTTIFGLGSIMNGLFNPEYGAFMEILSALK